VRDRVKRLGKVAGGVLLALGSVEGVPAIGRSTDGTMTLKDGPVWNHGRLLLGAGGPERSAVGTEQQQGIRSRLPALGRQQQTEQMSAAALGPGSRAAGRRGSVPNGDSRRVGVAEPSRSSRARRGSVNVSIGMFGGPSR
jgi:hypothetical protein